jgi:hypothetical protein
MFYSKYIFQFFMFGGESCKMRARGHFSLPVKNWFRIGGGAVEALPHTQNTINLQVCHAAYCKMCIKALLTTKPRVCCGRLPSISKLFGCATRCFRIARGADSREVWSGRHEHTIVVENDGDKRLRLSPDQEKELHARLAVLQEEHRDLDAAIAALADQVVADQLQLQRLKKRKLSLKDQIIRINDQLLPDIIA